MTAATRSASDGTRAPDGRKVVEVAVGVLIAPDHRLLITSRPEGKPMAGYWEFPGGKLEAGETVAQALARELWEELGLRIGTVHPWRVTEHDYPHAYVRLHWCKVYEWSGELAMREHQQYAWQQLPPTVGPMLPGAAPALAWLAEEGVYTRQAPQPQR